MRLCESDKEEMGDRASDGDGNNRAAVLNARK